MASFETNILVQHLRDCSYSNQMATFVEMSALISVDVRYKARYHLTQALEIVRRNYNFVFQNEVGVGYKPVPNPSVAGIVTRKRQGRIRGETHRWRQELDTVDTQQLSQDQLNSYIAANLKLCVQELAQATDINQRLERDAATTPSITGVEYLKHAAQALRDIS